jgi:DNA-binding NtrC family response regulator
MNELKRILIVDDDDEIRDLLEFDIKEKQKELDNLKVI